MSMMVITCDECGMPANIEVKEHQKETYCKECRQVTQKYTERKWLCFECATKWVSEKAEKSRQFAETYRKMQSSSLSVQKKEAKE